MARFTLRVFGDSTATSATSGVGIALSSKAPGFFNLKV